MNAMARRQLTSCCFALLAFVLVIVPQSAWPQGKAAETVANMQRLEALAAQIKQANDQPQPQQAEPPQQQPEPEPPPPQQPQTPSGERPIPGCIVLLGVRSSC